MSTTPAINETEFCETEIFQYCVGYSGEQLITVVLDTGDKHKVATLLVYPRISVRILYVPNGSPGNLNHEKTRSRISRVRILSYQFYKDYHPEMVYYYIGEKSVTDSITSSRIFYYCPKVAYPRRLKYKIHENT